MYTANGWIQLALVCLLSLRAAGSGVAEESAEPDEQALQAIEAAGGKVRRIAESVTWREVSFHLSPHPVSNEALAQLARIPDLRWLFLQGTSMTDEQMRYLAPLTSLHRLHLENTIVGDAGVEQLLPLQELEYLNLYGTQVSDAALPTLQRLKSLKQLYLWQSRVSEDGLQRLRAQMPDTLIVGALELSPPTPTPAEEEAAPVAAEEEPAAPAEEEEGATPDLSR